MKKSPVTKQRSPGAGSRIITSLREAVDWVEGKDVAVRVTTLNVPVIDVRATRMSLGLSQAAFAAKFGFHQATLKLISVASFLRGRSRAGTRTPDLLRAKQTLWLSSINIASCVGLAGVCSSSRCTAAPSLSRAPGRCQAPWDCIHPMRIVGCVHNLAAFDHHPDVLRCPDVR